MKLAVLNELTATDHIHEAQRANLRKVPQFEGFSRIALPIISLIVDLFPRLFNWPSTGSTPATNDNVHANADEVLRLLASINATLMRIKDSEVMPGKDTVAHFCLMGNRMFLRGCSLRCEHHKDAI